MKKLNFPIKGRARVLVLIDLILKEKIHKAVSFYTIQFNSLFINSLGFQADHWRQNLLNKLTRDQVYIKPEERPKSHQTVIIFDWDDTLLPTSFLIPYQALIY